MRDDSPESRRIRAEDAKQFMSNPLFRAMFAGVGEALEAKALACDLNAKDGPELAARIVTAKQILQGMRREIERLAEDGDFAAFEIAQIKKNGGFRLFQR
jgi:hypothetical protein